MPSSLPSDMLDPNTPPSVIVRDEARVPNEDPTLGISVAAPTTPFTHRLVTVGDSLTHGFQSAAIFNTGLSWPKIVAWEMGWDNQFRYPRYDGQGGLPINIEFLLRRLEQKFGTELNWWEAPAALFDIRSAMDEIEDWWERGRGSTVPNVNTINHNLGIYGWDVRDALDRTFTSCAASIANPKDNFFAQIVEDANDRAALRVLPRHPPNLSTVGAAQELGKEGIETLVVALGANNALGSVLKLGRPQWSKGHLVNGIPAYRHLDAKKAFTVWDPDHFKLEWAELVSQLEKINARHVILATVPHVTIAPIARGVGKDKVRTGSRFFPYYTRPWIEDTQFDPTDDEHITENEARAIDSAIDQYNETIVNSVRAARQAGKDWYVLELSGMLDRLAHRRYIDDQNARPSWWRPYELPGELRLLQPQPNSRFFKSDATGRLDGGLFSLDGVHPTTIGYGLMAQEVIRIMERAGVTFYMGNGTTQRAGPIMVDFKRLIAQDSLISSPPKNLRNALSTIGWIDSKVDFLKRLVRNAV